MLEIPPSLSGESPQVASSCSGVALKLWPLIVCSRGQARLACKVTHLACSTLVPLPTLIDQMEVSEILACQFSRWYPAYRQLTYRSQIIDLRQEFEAYLQEDGIFVPSGSGAVGPLLPTGHLHSTQLDTNHTHIWC